MACATFGRSATRPLLSAMPTVLSRFSAALRPYPYCAPPWRRCRTAMRVLIRPVTIFSLINRGGKIGNSCARSRSPGSKGMMIPAHGQNCTQPCIRSEEHTSELQSHLNLVCRLLLEKKKKTDNHERGHKTYLRVVMPFCPVHRRW